MSLSIQDNQKIADLFRKKEACDKDSHEYYKYRDAIFAHVLENLKDYFSVLKHEWKAKFKISDEDSISIIHDGLLAAVNNFQAGYESRNRTTKFLTYFVHILKNNVKNYVISNYVGAKRAKRNFHKIPLNAYVSLDHLLTYQNDEADREQSYVSEKSYLPLIKYLSDKSDYFDLQQNREFFIEQMLNKLPEVDRKIIKAILDGNNLRQIAKLTNMSSPSVKNRLGRLTKRFSIIETELCQ